MPLPQFSVEILEKIFQESSQQDVVNIMRACYMFSGIATRVLYQDISLLSTKQCRLCFETLLKNDLAASTVRIFCIALFDASEVGFRERHAAEDHSHINSEFNAVLMRLPRLMRLGIHGLPVEFKGKIWPFELISFSTSLPYHDGLYDFLIAQPKIIDLQFHGEVPRGAKVLPASALPNLVVFENNYTSSHCLGMFIRRRPLRHVGIKLSKFSPDIINMLRTTKMPIKKVSVKLWNRDGALETLKALSESINQATSLTLSLEMTNFSAALYHKMTPSISAFCRLKVLFIPPGPFSVISAKDEVKIVGAWSEVCPSLLAVLISSSHMWHRRSGKWGRYLLSEPAESLFDQI